MPKLKLEDLDELTPDHKFIVIAMMKSVVLAHEMGKTKKEFLKICESVWESMELNDIDHFKEFIQQSMEKTVQCLLDERGL